MSLPELSQRVIDLAAESSSDEDEFLLPANTFTSPRERGKDALHREKEAVPSAANLDDPLRSEIKLDLLESTGSKLDAVVKGQNPSRQMKEEREIAEPRMDQNSTEAEKATESASKKAEDESVTSIYQSSSQDEDNDTTKNHRNQNKMNDEREWGAYCSSSSIEFGSPLCCEEDSSIDDSPVKITQSQCPESVSSNPTLAEPSPDAEESDATIDLEKEDSTDKRKLETDNSGAIEYDTPAATKTSGRKRDSSSVDTRELLRKARARTKDFVSSGNEESMERFGGGKETPATKEKEIGLQTISRLAPRQRGNASENCDSRPRKSARVNSIEVTWTAEKRESYKRKYPCRERGKQMKRGHVSRFCTACDCCISCIIPPWCPQRQHHSLKIISPVQGDKGLNEKAHDEKRSRPSNQHRQRPAKHETSKKRERPIVPRTSVKKTKLDPVRIETKLSSKKSPRPGEDVSDFDTGLPLKKKSPGPRESLNDFDTERPVSEILCRDIPFQPQQGNLRGTDADSTPPNRGRSTAPDPPGTVLKKETDFQLPLTIDKGAEGIGQGTHLAPLFKAALASNVALDAREVGIEQPAAAGQSSTSPNMAPTSLPEQLTAANLVYSESKRASTAQHDSVTVSKSKIQASPLERPKQTSPSKTASAAANSRSTWAEPLSPTPSEPRTSAAGYNSRSGSTLADQPSPSNPTNASRITEHSVINGSTSDESTALISRPDVTPIALKTSKLDPPEQMASSMKAPTLPSKATQLSGHFSFLQSNGAQSMPQRVVHVLAIIGFFSCFHFVSSWLSCSGMEE